MSAEKDEQAQAPVVAPETAAIADENAVKAAAANAERERIAAITGCEEANGRASLASHLAFKTGMSVDEAKATLAASPKEQEKATGQNKLDEAMKATGGGPEVGADGGDAPADKAEDPAAKILADYDTARGVKPATRH